MAIYNLDCVVGSQQHLSGESIDLMICDPPFGIGESSFQKHYNRSDSNVLQGYQEAPDDYYQFTYDWMGEAKRVLKSNGSFYVISGHTNLNHVLNAGHALDFNLVNHIIWKYNFGVYTRKKFVTSHYHVLYYSKHESAKLTFNTHCRFGPQEKDSDGGSLLYQDMEDVWYIKKQYDPNKQKNSNKLPDDLIEKMTLYSSNPGDVVCDFFMGNFTTAIVAHGLGRQVVGYEINTEAYNSGIKRLESIGHGDRLRELKKVEIINPKNSRKPIDDKTRASIKKDFASMVNGGKTKSDAIIELCNSYQRGKFSIQRILRG